VHNVQSQISVTEKCVCYPRDFGTALSVDGDVDKVMQATTHSGEHRQQTFATNYVLNMIYTVHST